jgi:hypothetical protein
MYTLTPLALDQIAVDATYYGVRITSSEDDDLMAIGTRDLRRVVAAFSRYTRVFYKEPLRSFLGLCPACCANTWCLRNVHTTLQLSCGWATFHAPDPADDDAGDSWHVEMVSLGTPSALPLVVAVR